MFGVARAAFVHVSAEDNHSKAATNAVDTILTLSLVQQNQGLFIICNQETVGLRSRGGWATLGAGMLQRECRDKTMDLTTNPESQDDRFKVENALI